MVPLKQWETLCSLNFRQLLCWTGLLQSLFSSHESFTRESLTSLTWELNISHMGTLCLSRGIFIALTWQFVFLTSVLYIFYTSAFHLLTYDRLTSLALKFFLSYHIVPSHFSHESLISVFHTGAWYVSYGSFTFLLPAQKRSENIRWEHSRNILTESFNVLRTYVLISPS